MTTAYAIDEGNGATLTLGISTWASSALLTKIEFEDQSREPVETSGLVTTIAKTYTPGDLIEPGALTVEFLHIDAIEAPFLDEETVTVTYPIGQGQTTPATVAAKGFLLDYKFAGATNGEIMKGEAKWKFTGPITVEAATVEEE